MKILFSETKCSNDHRDLSKQCTSAHIMISVSLLYLEGGVLTILIIYHLCTPLKCVPINFVWVNVLVSHKPKWVTENSY